MPSFQFVGQYLGRSQNVGCVRYVNCFPHQTQDNRLVVFGTPGLVPWESVGGSGVRGMLVMGDYVYVVIGGALHYFDAVGGHVVVSSSVLLTSSGIVGMAHNGQQLMIVDGQYGYIYTPSTGVFVRITSAGFPVNPHSVAFLDGYFIVDHGETNQFNFSALYDGLTWDALDFHSAEASPDNVMAVTASYGYLYVFGAQTTEIWYDAGDPLGVFLRADGMVSNVGLLARASVARVGETGAAFCWLAASPQGHGFAVLNAGGANTQRISTPEVEYLWSQLERLDDAVAYAYMQEGHTFYVLSFPAGNATWVYDLTTQIWHERSTSDGRSLGQTYAFYSGMHLVGSYQTGTLYRMAMDVYTDDVYPILRTIQSPTLGDDDTGPISYQSMQVDMERGVGLPSGQGSDPQVMLSWSSDAGHTWCDEITGGIGAQGVYDRRVIFRRLGRSFRRTWRLRMSDPVKFVVLSATIKTE